MAHVSSVITILHEHTGLCYLLNIAT